jgi:hypothetical protein
MGKVLRRTGLTCVALIVLYFVIPLHANDSLPLWVGIGLTVFSLAAIVVGIKNQLLRQLNEPEAPLGGLLAGVVAGIVLFSLADYSTAVYLPGEFSGLHTRLDALYFALATLFTIGYGDVAAQGQFARGLLCVQMLFDVLVLATAGSVLSQQVRTRARERHRA